MRLGIFVASIVALILVCRFYSLPATTKLSEGESIPSVAMAVYDAPVDDGLVLAPNQVLESSTPNPAQALPPAFNSSRSLLPESTQKDLYSVAKSGIDANAKNVQLLVRAQYEIPKSAAELLMKLDTEMLVETTELESGHPDVAILQVTTDEATQKQFAGFLSALYPQESIENLRERSGNRRGHGTSELRRDRNARNVTASEIPSPIGTDSRF